MDFWRKNYTICQKLAGNVLEPMDFQRSYTVHLKLIGDILDGYPPEPADFE